MKRSTVLLSLVCIVGALAAFIAGVRVGEARANRSASVVRLGGSLERLGFTASSLRLLESGERERLSRLLWFGLSLALESAEREIAVGARLPAGQPHPDLLEYVRRAQATAATGNDPALAKRVAAVAATVGVEAKPAVTP